MVEQLLYSSLSFQANQLFSSFVLFFLHSSPSFFHSFIHLFFFFHLTFFCMRLCDPSSFRPASSPRLYQISLLQFCLIGVKSFNSLESMDTLTWKYLWYVFLLQKCGIVAYDAPLIQEKIITKYKTVTIQTLITVIRFLKRTLIDFILFYLEMLLYHMCAPFSLYINLLI